MNIPFVLFVMVGVARISAVPYQRVNIKYAHQEKNHRLDFGQKGNRAYFLDQNKNDNYYLGDEEDANIGKRDYVKNLLNLLMVFFLDIRYSSLHPCAL